MKKYTRELLRMVRAQGVRILATSLTSRGHLRIEFLDCENAPHAYYTGSTPSCPRAQENAVRGIVRIANRTGAA